MPRLAARSRSLVATDPTGAPRPASARAAFGQYFTPCWAAEALLERFFPTLDGSDLVLEPTCGPGHFLQALPEHVPALGVEIDPRLAEEARRRTGRRILTGDIRTVPIDVTPTAIIGNPPFGMGLIDAILERSWDLLPEGGRAGFILPAYALGTAGRVARLAERWSIHQELLPRNLYPRLSHALVFGLFSKDRRRTLVGFALYREADAVQQLAADVRRALHHGATVGDPRLGLDPQGDLFAQACAAAAAAGLTAQRRSAWWAAVEPVLRALGGEADLADIYAAMSGRRPTPNPFWKDKVRQICQEHCVRVRTGRYALRAA